ncbi:hypothetical protein GCM10022409_00510 [Hymenobacter glaciei]|uniref:SH3b domain-containing protein n=1 Tax=Hymenobacter glaciei TaxID=877209 RepID=A0ABP7T4H0_9BACT
MLLGLSGLTSCSDDPPHRKDSEMTVDAPPAATAETPAARAADETPVEEPSGALPQHGRKYQVIVETAYFFDRPVQSTPNGRYLRRGDTFYGQGESNGFVKAGFVQPNGASGTAWLKAQGLRKLPGGAATGAAKATPAARPATRPPATQTDAAYETNASASSTAKGQGNAPATSATKALVEVDRAYFYNSPDLGQPRKAFCQRGDKVRVLESSGDAVRVTFTNWEKVTTTGWMRKDALRFSR